MKKKFSFSQTQKKVMVVLRRFAVSLGSFQGDALSSLERKSTL